MTEDAVAALANAAAKQAALPFGLMQPQVLQVDGRLVWRVDSATVGGDWRVEVDDATGAAGPLTWWGTR